SSVLRDGKRRSTDASADAGWRCVGRGKRSSPNGSVPISTIVMICFPLFTPLLYHIFVCEPAAPGYGHDGPTYIVSGFFEELQRRKVYRVAAAYIVAAGFLIQIA